MAVNRFAVRVDVMVHDCSIADRINTSHDIIRQYYIRVNEFNRFLCALKKIVTQMLTETIYIK